MALPPVYNIWIRSINIDDGVVIGLRRQALVTDYVKLEFKRRYNNVGGWILLMQDGTEQAMALRQIFIGSSSDPVGATSSGQGFGGIVVTRNGEVVFSGPVRGFTATGDENDGPMIEFHGTDDTGYLADRLVMVPAPVSSGLTDFSAPSNQGWISWTYPIGVGQTRTSTDVLATLVNNNIGITAPFNIGGVQNRRIPFLTIPPSPHIGPNTLVRGRYQNLLEKCQEVATYIQFDPSADDYDPTYHGIQFDIHQTDDDMLLFDYRQPNDLTNLVVFNVGSPFEHTGGNIGTYQYKLDAPMINFSVLAGQNDSSDDPTTRWFAHRGQQFNPYTSSIKSPSVLVFGLREGFLDRRDIQYAGPTFPPGNADYDAMIKEFTRAMDGQLREQGEITDLKITAINVSPTEFFVNYNLGDLVTVRIEGQNIQAQVMDVTVTLTKDEGEVVQPTIGTQVIGSTTRLFNQIYQTQKDITGLNTGF